MANLENILYEGEHIFLSVSKKFIKGESGLCDVALNINMYLDGIFREIDTRVKCRVVQMLDG